MSLSNVETRYCDASRDALKAIVACVVGLIMLSPLLLMGGEMMDQRCGEIVFFQNNVGMNLEEISCSSCVR